MQPTYSKESHQTQRGDHVFTVTNMTPIYSSEENLTVRRSIEKTLYQVFSQHSSRTRRPLAERHP